MIKKKNVEKKFLEDGYFDFGSILNKKDCLILRDYINKKRPCSKKIFYKNEKEFLKKGRFKNYSPGEKDHNAIFNLNLNLDFIEKSKKFKKCVEAIVGKDYIIKKKSIIRSVPRRMHPKWALSFTKDIGRPNVNPYIKEEYQDVQYFQNVDFHQDMTRGIKFVTFYIYLDKVNKIDSPLNILSGTYKFGSTHYPHYLRPSESKNIWYYSNLQGNHMKSSQVSISGGVGKVFCFHGLNLHGTKLNNSKKPRISLRYLIQCNEKKNKNNIFLKSFKNCIGKIVEKRKLKNGFYFQRLDRTPKGNFLKTGSSIL